MTAALLWTIPARAQSPATSYRLTPAAKAFRDATYLSHPCLARIVDVEDGSWDPTISWHGGHDPNNSYGLPQANPGTKMASAGPLWATDRATQLRWMSGYARARYGSECGALAYRLRNGSY